MYEGAFAMAIENGFVQDAALAKELSWQVRELNAHTRNTCARTVTRSQMQGSFALEVWLTLVCGSTGAQRDGGSGRG
jgi:hypothetical protein